MTQPDGHTRRDFLQGRAAARTLADKAQELVDTVSARLDVPSASAAFHIHASRRAMACEFAIQYHASSQDISDDILAAFDLIESLEDQMTIYREQSEVIAINEQAADGPVEVEANLFSLLELAARIYRETDGAFDITSTPLSKAWGFLRREGRVPSELEIQAARNRVGFDKVLLNEEDRSIQFTQSGVEINLNSIGKGYALDEATRFLDNRGTTDYLWHGGRSSILARGINQADTRQAWTLGLRHPLQPERRLAEFHLRDQALATAGGATQFFEHEGRQFSHILDPRTGWPVDGVYTATAVAPTAAEADALATAFYVMGVEAVAEYCSTHPDVGAAMVCPADEPSGIALYSFGLNPENWARLDIA